MNNQTPTKISMFEGLILIIPIFGIFVGGWNWTLSDFVLAIIFYTVVGFALYLAKKIINPKHRVIASTAIVIISLLIWIELSVGFVEEFAGLL